MSECQLKLVGKREDGKFLLKCSTCGKERASKYDDPKLSHAACGVSTDNGGPGSELAKLFKGLGFKPNKSCGCEALRKEMDVLGVEGCRLQFDRLVGVLREKYQATSWTERIRAGGLAVLTGVAFKLNVGDPIPDLIREAIRRASGS